MCTDKLCQRFVCHRLARVLPSRQRLGKLESQNHLSSKMWTEFFPLIGIMLSISLSRSFLVLLLATIVSPAAANQPFFTPTFLSRFFSNLEFALPISLK